MPRIVAAVCSAFAALALSACAQLPQSASQASLTSVGDLLARTWGAEPGSPREALARGFIGSLANDPTLNAASKRKSILVTHEKFWGQLEKEGFAMLPDAALRQAAALKLRLLQNATPEECQSYLATVSSGAWLGPESTPWRKRLARASDEDFWSSMQLSKEALLERARRINELPVAFSEKEYLTAFGTLVLATPESDRDEMFAISERPGEPKAADVCRFVLQLLKAQTAASGAPLRIGYVNAPN